MIFKGYKIIILHIFFVASTIVAGEGVLHDPTLLKEKGMLQTSLQPLAFYVVLDS